MLPLVTTQTVAFDRGFGGRILARENTRQASSSRSTSNAKLGPAGGVVAAGVAGAGLAVGAAGGMLASAARGSASVASAASNVVSPGRRAAAEVASNAGGGGQGGAAAGAPSAAEPPAWAARMKRSQTVSHGVSAATNAVRSGDHGGGGASVDLSEGER